MSYQLPEIDEIKTMDYLLNPIPSRTSIPYYYDLMEIANRCETLLDVDALKNICNSCTTDDNIARFRQTASQENIKLAQRVVERCNNNPEKCHFGTPFDVPAYGKITTSICNASMDPSSVRFYDVGVSILYPPDQSGWDHVFAAQWLALAADNGSFDAACQLGEMYSRGLPSLSSESKSISYYTLAMGTKPGYLDVDSLNVHVKDKTWQDNDHKWTVYFAENRLIIKDDASGFNLRSWDIDDQGRWCSYVSSESPLIPENKFWETAQSQTLTKGKECYRIYQNGCEMQIRERNHKIFTFNITNGDSQNLCNSIGMDTCNPQ